MDRRLRLLGPKNEVTVTYNELGEEIIHKKCYDDSIKKKLEGHVVLICGTVFN
jgi:hypothetical protein